MSEPLIHRYFQAVLRHRVATLMICALLTALALASASRSVVASSIGKLFLDEMPEYAEYHDRARAFGNDEIFLVAYEDADPLSPDSLDRLEGVVERLREDPEVARVTSLLDAVRLDGGGGGLRAERYADIAREQGSDVARAALLEEPLYRGGVIADDGRAGAVLVELTVDPYRPAERGPELVAEVMGALEAAGWAREDLHRTGLPALVAAMMDETWRNISRLFPLSAAALLGVVWLLFRRLTPAAVTMGVGLVSVIWTLGFATVLDREFSIFTALVPAVVLTVAFSDIVHLWSAYHLELRRGLARRDAILASASDVGRACLLTSLTTFTGFISIAAVPTPVSRQLGVVLGFGVGAALLLAMTLVPVALSYLPAPDLSGPPRRDALDRLVDGCRRLSTQRPGQVLAAFAVACLPIGYGLSRYTIGTDFTQRFPEEHDYRRDARFFEQRFEGLSTVTVYLETPAAGGLEDPALMGRVAAYHDALEALEDVDEVLSPVDVLRAEHAALTGEAGMPTRPGSIAQYLLLLEMTGDGAAEDAMAGLMDFDRRALRMEVRTPLTGFRELGALGERVAAAAPAELEERAEITVTGVSYLLGSYFEEILRGQRAGMAFSLVVIGGVMAAGLRSLRAGALSMIPNLLPLAVVIAAAACTWDAVDSDLLIAALMAIGIGVDDTIHFLMRYRVECRRDPREALERTFAFAGRAIAMTTAILCAGFLPFALSDYFTVRMLGTFLPLALLTAVLADLLLAPAMARLGWFGFGVDSR